MKIMQHITDYGGVKISSTDAIIRNKTFDK